MIVIATLYIYNSLKVNKKFHLASYMKKDWCDGRMLIRLSLSDEIHYGGEADTRIVTIKRMHVDGDGVTT